MQVYAPTDDCSKEVNDGFYSELQEVIGKTAKREASIVIGDLKARVRRNKQVWGSVGQP